MATIGNSVLTLADLMKGRKGDGQFDTEIVDLVVQENPMLDDITFVEANDGTTNRTTIRTGIPEPTWVGYYEGVQPVKGTKAQVKDTCGKMKAMLEIDADLYDNCSEGGQAQLIADELGGIAEGMKQAMSQAVIYGKLADEPRAFNGLGKYYAIAGADNASYDDKDSAHYVFSGAKSASPSKAALRSIYLVGWSPRTITGFYPKNAKSAGLDRGKFDRAWALDSNGGRYEVYRQALSWEMGLSVRDYRYAGRIANIESDAMLAASGQPDYIEILHRLVTRVKNGAGVRQALYMSPLVWEYVQTLFYRATQANAVQYRDIEQRKAVPTLMGIPVRICDAMEVNEEFLN